MITNHYYMTKGQFPWLTKTNHVSNHDHIRLVTVWVQFTSSVHSILTMCGADGVSFVESLPQLSHGKNWPGVGCSSRSPHFFGCILMVWYRGWLAGQPLQEMCWCYEVWFDVCWLGQQKLMLRGASWLASLEHSSRLSKNWLWGMPVD